MNLREFHNGLRILLGIDRQELEAAGVIAVPSGQGVYPGCMDEPNQKWQRFREDPFRFLIRCDDETADKIWSVIERRAESD